MKFFQFFPLFGFSVFLKKLFVVGVFGFCLDVFYIMHKPEIIKKKTISEKFTFKLNLRNKIFNNLSLSLKLVLSLLNEPRI